MLPRRSPTRRPARFARLAVVAALLGLATLGGAAQAAAEDDAPSSWALPTSGNLLSAFNRNSYNEQDGAPQQVDDPRSPGRPALMFSLDGGDQRSELQPRTPYLREGNVVYYSYRAYLDPDFPTDVNTWQLILQWHQEGDSGSPPVAVEVRNNRLQLVLTGDDYQDLGPVSGGQTVDLILRIAFSQDPDKGTVDVWNGGRHVLNAFHPASGTLIDDSAYEKVGLYRDRSIDQPARLYLEDLRIGPAMSSVRATDAPALSEGPAPAATTSAGTSGSPLFWTALVLVGVVLAVALLRPWARRP
ncbi:MAG: hypothetical protein QOE59_1596 [Actinomycetota bacterium]|nr:hypothetical protein [Actinomycetota bacterium]